MATDGFWDVLTNEEANQVWAQALAQKACEIEIAERLVLEAR